MGSVPDCMPALVASLSGGPISAPGQNANSSCVSPTSVLEPIADVLEVHRGYHVAWLQRRIPMNTPYDKAAWAVAAIFIGFLAFAFHGPALARQPD